MTISKNHQHYEQTRRRCIGSIASLAALGLVGGCGFRERPSTIGYRLRVVVDTPQGVRSGSSVFRVTTWTQRSWGNLAPIGRELHLEAAAVRLPTGILFAVPRDENGTDYPAYLLLKGLERGVVNPPLSRDYGGGEWREMQEEARRVKPRITLDPRDYPWLVRFRDIAVPSSVERVDPSDLSASFGPGVRLRQIDITVTDDRPTAEIVKLLPWLPQYRDKSLLGNQGAYKIGVVGDGLSQGSFTTEIGR